MRSLSLVVALLVVGVLGDPTPRSFATEPYGHVFLQADWREDDRGTRPGDRRVVRLSLRSSRSLDDVELTVSLPASFAVKPVLPAWDSRFRTIAARQNQRAIRAGLDRLVESKWVTVEFEVVLPPLGDGVISFDIEGRDGTGRRIHEAIGLAARDAGSPGTLRLGAVEFPAAVLPSESPR